ncbi:hypothetical protein CDAR_598391 [Caerostris darwini]|uniref:Uncharacterized protein n=1 Tax=Caerostris darwini TaxID=1538125 RepID=A0AAV4QN21_9ARAC|nr:hypothetical protein CDAR_598391 [Caerostris darwini]
MTQGRGGEGGLAYYRDENARGEQWAGGFMAAIFHDPAKISRIRARRPDSDHCLRTFIIPIGIVTTEIERFRTVARAIFCPPPPYPLFSTLLPILCSS